MYLPIRPTDLRKIPDLLDFFIIRNISTNYVSIEGNFNLDSGHAPVILNMSENVNKKSNCVKFQEDVSNNMQLKVPLRTVEQLNLEAQNAMEQIRQGALKNTPKIKRLLAGNNYLMEIKQLVTE
jgi:hypothetical protein